MANHVAEYLLKKYGKNNPPAVKAGDTVRIHQRIKEGEKERVQIFEGLVIAVKHGAGLEGTFTVRKIATAGVGVERTYPLHSPNVLKVERVKTAEVSRAKLYYMRDRLGKAARFKSEQRSPMTWEESAVTLPVEEEVVAEEEVAVQPEGTIEEEVLETAAEATETPTESQEVIAATLGETLAEEEEKAE